MILIEKIKHAIKYKRFLKQWRLENQHNTTTPTSIFPIEIVNVGKATYGDLNIVYWNAKKERLNIGHFVSIATNVTFILGGNHHTNTILSYPTINLSKKGCGSYTKGAITIEDDVWIGYGATILSGVKIGKGAIIGACSLVAKDIPPYAVAVGNPLKIIKYRFSEKIINNLLTLDYSKLDINAINENINCFNQPLTTELIKKIQIP